MSHEIRPGGSLGGLGDLRGDYIEPPPARNLRQGVPTGPGMGDYVEPPARYIEPGSRRRPPDQIIEDYLPPGRGGVSVGDDRMVQALLRALEIIKERYGGLPTQETRFHTAQANAYVIGVNPLRIDLPVRRERRAVVITNTHVANFVWYGFDNTVRVNNGGFLAPGGQSTSIPLDENVQVWVIASGAGTVVSILQYA